MLNFILENLPVFVNVDCEGSTACDAIILSPLTRRAIVKWQSGTLEGYDCRRRDMIRLLADLKQSAGQWANRYALA